MEFVKKHAGLLIIALVLLAWILVLVFSAKRLVVTADLRDAVEGAIPSVKDRLAEPTVDTPQQFDGDALMIHINSAWAQGPAETPRPYPRSLLAKPIVKRSTDEARERPGGG